GAAHEWAGSHDEALHQLLPDGVAWHVPTGGYFVWLTLPDGLDGAAVRRLGHDERVDVRQGALFSTTGGLARNLRLSFAHYPAAGLAEGVTRLGRAVRTALS
ncbi:MAG: PLP-dependent aminotransferase family protein, partial [Ilumatobacteraceae bacterium]